MKKNNKLILISSLMITNFLVVSCGETPSSSSEEEFKNSVTSTLTDEDYIEHNMTDFKEGDYNDTMWYINKLKDVPLPDPQVYVEDDVYYITGTSDRSSCKNIDIYYTEDFVNYKKALNVFTPTSNGWEAKDNPLFYAPEIYCFDNVYYMYYSAVSKKDGYRYNSVVKADNPLGPYEYIINDKVNGEENPLFNFGKIVSLDATIFVDDNKEMYMYMSMGKEEQYIAGVKMKSPYEIDLDTYKELARPGYIDSSFDKNNRKLEWEMYRSYYILEAPFMIKSPKNGKYYLTYSANGCWNKYYSVCYAESDSPLGNFVKPYEENELWTNLLFGYSGEKEGTIFNQWSGFASGTGHHCFFNIGEQVMIGYHAHQNRDWNADDTYTNRYFGMDYLYFDNDGKPYCNGPTNSLQPLPESISSYKNIASTASVKTQNVENESFINDDYIVDNYNLKGEEEKEVKLNEGYSYIRLTFDKEYEIGGFSLSNSAYYEKIIDNIVYVDFGNGNAVRNLEISQYHINDENEFVFPCSGFTFEFNKKVKSNSVTICFNNEKVSYINEIKVLGK